MKRHLSIYLLSLKVASSMRNNLFPGRVTEKMSGTPGVANLHSANRYCNLLFINDYGGKIRLYGVTTKIRNNIDNISNKN